MQEAPAFSWSAYFSLLNRASQRLLKNYVENYSGYNHDLRDIALTYINFFSKIAVNPHELVKIQSLLLDYLKDQQQVWQAAFLQQGRQALVNPQKGDKRFLAKEWEESSWFSFIKQNYLLSERLADRIIEEVEIDDKTKRRLSFYNHQYINLLSPANFLLTNPEALRIAIESKGLSLWKGFLNLTNDIEKGRITQTDESAFEVGRNLAVTPGSVIFENALMQLIQYAPSTGKVYERPLLMIPPWINKYYILDLQPDNSFVKFLVDQGITVYMISWRNPGPGEGRVSFEAYVSEGAMKAIEVARTVSSCDQINALGYCLGGTLLSIAAAVLSARKEKNPLHTVTLLAAMIDFSDIGPMGDVIDGALVKKFERGELLEEGIFHGYDMERAFNLIRVNDLVWNYAVNNYLKGIPPAPFDIMYWTNDNTNLPAAMYKYYIRNMVLENQLSRKNALKLCQTDIDISRIDLPVFVISFSEDYIAPARTGFISTTLVSGPVEFILGGSGHVVGTINPPGRNKYGYYTDGKPDGSYEEWRSSARYNPGSWWPCWSSKLIPYSGKQVPAPRQQGNTYYPVLEAAPGKYVKEKH